MDGTGVTSTPHTWKLGARKVEGMNLTQIYRDVRGEKICAEVSLRTGEIE